jgi:phosphoribosylformylglycinamidine synthase
MWRVEVGFKPGVIDALGNQVKQQIIEDLRLQVDEVRTVSVYLINAKLERIQVEEIASKLLTDPITQCYSINSPLFSDFDQAIQVGYKPGVTDNVAVTTKEGISDLLGYYFSEEETLHTARLYLLKSQLGDEEIKLICTGLLANPIIEDFYIWRPGEQPANNLPIYRLPYKPHVEEIDLNVSDQKLVEISKKGLLALNLTEMRAIRAYFEDPKVVEERKAVGLSAKPTDVELEMLAQTWSEHCKHKIMNATIEYEENGQKETIHSLFKTYIKRATEELAKDKNWLVSVFVDNAGIISFDDNYNLVFKVETHNHPSALDPYGGAVTGIVGVNRDPLGTGLGADLIFNTDVFCFGPPDFPYEKLPPHVLHPKRIFRGVRKGVEDGGNKIGIPTVNGAIIFDEAYVYNPLVYCGTGGIMPKKVAKLPSHKKEIKSGDLIVMVGGRIGKDGIHGATFSSIKLDEETPATTVQIGAPIVQKRMQDVLKEARDRGLYRAITDNGAGGLSSSVGEMAQLCGGCEVDLEKAPTKYPGLNPWELWLSESQERMTLAVAPKKIEEFLELCSRRDVEATVIGRFVASGKIHVRYAGKTVAYLDIDFVHQGLPELKLRARWPRRKVRPVKVGNFDLTESLIKILSSLNVCSKEWVIRQYDHEVQGATVLKPLVGVSDDGPSDAAVLKPIRGSRQGVVVANGINPKYGEIDPYWMAASAIDEAVRNAVAVGADPTRIAVLDNFCWGNPIKSKDNPDGDVKLAQLVRAAKGCYDTALGLGTPFISGKDSFHNEYQLEDRTVTIPPTLLISALGIIEDCQKAVSMDVKEAGHLIYVVGETHVELGGSHFLMVNKGQGGLVPRHNPVMAKKTYQQLHQAILKRLIRSCHDCSEGGLAVALAESAFAGGLGMFVEANLIPASEEMPPWVLLFSESNSRFVVTVEPERQTDFEKVMEGTVFAKVGVVTKEPLLNIVDKQGQSVIRADILELKEAWQKPLQW